MQPSARHSSRQVRQRMLKELHLRQRQPMLLLLSLHACP
jgi:hypothetical protein